MKVHQLTKNKGWWVKCRKQVVEWWKLCWVWNVFYVNLRHVSFWHVSFRHVSFWHFQFSTFSTPSKSLQNISPSYGSWPMWSPNRWQCLKLLGSRRLIERRISCSWPIRMEVAWARVHLADNHQISSAYRTNRVIRRHIYNQKEKHGVNIAWWRRKLTFLP